ncbi:hypothetical protein T09_9692 [Trichinella sp. T9]|nr:hypothetical protein T09_9692 [Trichinella sp. T9]
MCMKEAAGRYLLFFCSASNCVPALYEPLAGAVLPVNREAVSLASQRKPSKRHISGQTHHLGGSSLSEPSILAEPFARRQMFQCKCSAVSVLRLIEHKIGHGKRSPFFQIDKCRLIRSAPHGPAL